MRRILVAALLSLLATCIGAPHALAQAAPLRMQVRIGYDGYYSAAAWVPIRATVRNLGSESLSGYLIAQGAAPGASVYRRPVVLPAGGQKDLTVYMPGSDIDGTVDVRLVSDGSTAASTSLYPNPYPDTDLVTAAVTDEPDSIAWLRTVRPRHAAARLVVLSPDTLDAVPEALDAFGAIVLTNVDASRIDAAHLSALERYVRDGGSLILVGGPAWQSTLSSLPVSLLPGRLTGTRTVTGLDGLRSIATHVPPHRPTALSILQPDRGAVIGAQSGVPLIVKAGLGNGLIEYLAFDPSSAPLAGWAGASPINTTLVAGAAPNTMRRTVLLPVDRARSFLNPGVGTLDIGAELDNFSLPPAVVLFIEPLLVVGCVVLVGLLVLFVTFRLRARWPITLGAATLAGFLALHLAPVAADHATVINTLNAVYLDGPGQVHPAVRYVGVYGPAESTRSLQYDQLALGVNATTPGSDAWFGDGGYPSASTVFDEDTRSSVSLPVGAFGVTRPVSLRTTVSIPGGIDTSLHLSANGEIVGTVFNRTPFRLLAPALIAGRSFVRLPAVPAGGRTAVRLTPSADPTAHDYPDIVQRVYGHTVPDYAAMARHRAVPLPGAPAGLPPEHTLAQRIRNAANAIPESHLVSLFGEVTLLAWTDRPLATVMLDGATASHRDLTLLIRPASISLPSGHFILREGVLGAWPAEVTPEPPAYPCCGPTVQPISLGPGGSATFAFDLPPTTRLHLTRLSLDVYAGGADPSASGYEGLPRGALSVLDWGSERWVPLEARDGTSRLLHPERYISHTGVVLVRLTATPQSGDLSILDPHQDVQLSGAGIAG